MLTKKEIIEKQNRAKNKKESTQPFAFYIKTTPIGNKTLSSVEDGSNSTQYKNTINKGQDGKENSSLSNQRLNNQGSKVSKLKESIQKINNYRAINQKENEQSKQDKITNSKDIDHKKWGIRRRQADSSSIITSRGQQHNNNK